MFIAASTETPQKVDVWHLRRGHFIAQVIGGRFFDAEKITEGTHKPTTAKNAERLKHLGRWKFGSFQRVLENLGKALCMRVNVGVGCFGGLNWPNVAHEAIDGDFFPLAAHLGLIGFALGKVDRVHMGVPAVRFGIGDFVAPHRAGDITEKRSRAFAMPTLMQPSE